MQVAQVGSMKVKQKCKFQILIDKNLIDKSKHVLQSPDAQLSFNLTVILGDHLTLCRPHVS